MAGAQRRTSLALVTLVLVHLEPTGAALRHGRSSFRPTTLPSTRKAVFRGATCACCRSAVPCHTFTVRVDTDEGAVKLDLRPLFSESELLTVRLPLPILLNAAQHAGMFRVTSDGFGLRRGDVLRACTSYRQFEGSAMGKMFGLAAWSKYLFVADGHPMDIVFEALTANTEERGATEVMLFMERELHPRGRWEA